MDKIILTMFIFENFKKIKKRSRKTNIRISLERKTIRVTKEELKYCDFFRNVHTIFDSDIEFLRFWHYYVK